MAQVVAPLDGMVADLYARVSLDTRRHFPELAVLLLLVF